MLTTPSGKVLPITPSDEGDGATVVVNHTIEVAPTHSTPVNLSAELDPGRSTEGTALALDRSHGAAPQWRKAAHRISPVALPRPADPDNPFLVERSHLMKMENGKSSGSSKMSYVTRPKRGAKLQEYWCASFEEACVYECIAAHPGVAGFAEQLTRVDYWDEEGKARFTVFDATVLMRHGEIVLVSVKYDEKARRASYVSEVSTIAAQTPRKVADRIVVLSRFSFHPGFRKCAREIHLARRGWDPEADRIALDAASGLEGQFTFRQLVDRTRLEERGYRAAVRLIGDGEIGKHSADPFKDGTKCWRVA